MFAKLKEYLRRRRIAQIRAEIQRVKALRMSMTQREFNLRGQLATLESGL